MGGGVPVRAAEEHAAGGAVGGDGAVRAGGEAVDAVGVPVEEPDEPARGRLPHPDALVPRPGEHPRPGGAQRVHAGPVPAVEPRRRAVLAQRVHPEHGPRRGAAHHPARATGGGGGGGGGGAGRNGRGG
jgi:hypothetical protein